MEPQIKQIIITDNGKQLCMKTIGFNCAETMGVLRFQEKKVFAEILEKGRNKNKPLVADKKGAVIPEILKPKASKKNAVKINRNTKAGIKKIQGLLEKGAPHGFIGGEPPKKKAAKKKKK